MKFELERSERLLNDIKMLIDKNTIDIPSFKVLDDKRQDGYLLDKKDWNIYTCGEMWHNKNQHRWFFTTVTVSDEWAGQCVALRITTGREGEWDATNPQLLLYVNNTIKQALDVNHTRSILTKHATGGEYFDITFLAYAGSNYDRISIEAKLVLIDREIESLYFDLKNPIESARLIKIYDATNSRRTLLSVEKALNHLDLRVPYSDDFYDSVEKVRNVLKDDFYTTINMNAPVVSAVGHTHIDIAWLWTVEETKEKAVRSFSTVLDLMEQYPDYKFMSSQPILYQFVKERAPELYKKIKARIQEGRWEVDGAMWLEADCNISSGESLIRHIIKGENFFKEEFGIKSKSLWLPDVFGYSAVLPQILKRSGIDYFMTTKIAWNQYNQLPNDTFMWKGIDGSEVFTFMVTACDFEKNLGLGIAFTDTRNTTTYTGMVNPNMILGAYERFQNKDLTEDTLMLFGFGDGGGGPTYEMLENVERLKYGLPGIPRIKQEFETDFFDRTYNMIRKKENMPTWRGELYLEYHRGTYTSMGKNKRYNRRSEIAYRNLEILGSLLAIAGGDYPAQTIAQGWDIILLNQFHDIIPGTSIEEVYDVTDGEYKQILEDAKVATDTVLKNLIEDAKHGGSTLCVFNTLSYTRTDIVPIKNKKSLAYAIDEYGIKMPVQKISEDIYIFVAKDVPSMGYKIFSFLEEEITLEEKTFDFCFENDFYVVSFNKQLEITSLIEKISGKQLMESGNVGNRLVTFEDRPMNWDNWDIDIYHKRKPYYADHTSDVCVIQTGSVRTTLEITHHFSQSTVIQKIHLYSDLPCIEFENDVDWKNSNLLLKTEFNTALNAQKATYDIQYGNVERPTTSNHSWDTAMFETCAHKWGDVSERGAGLSLLNDCKYGYDIKDSVIRLTLIKAGTYPHKTADIGQHTFTYALYPHNGDCFESKTYNKASNLNTPFLYTWTKNSMLHSKSMMSLDVNHCYIEAIKKSEDAKGYVVRVVEYENREAKVNMTLPQDITVVHECNLLEEKEMSIAVRNGTIEFVIKPHEIKSFYMCK